MAHNRVAIAFENIGDFRRALEHYENALDSLKKSGIRYNLFWQKTAVQYRLKIVNALQKLEENEAALANLREALNLHRQATEIDHANPHSKHSHAEVFFAAGKIFVVADRFEEAIAAYLEAETFWLERLPVEPYVQSHLGGLYLAIGDLYAKNATNLRETKNWYQKSHAAFTKLAENNLATAKDKENLHLAEEKIRLIEKAKM